MSVDFPAHPFWDFSLEVYGRAGVPEACLEVQEAHGVDVNVILFCCWLGRTGRGRLARAETEAMRAAVAQWHEVVVRGVRAVRQRLKGGMPPAPVALSDPLRRRLAAIEVQLEHVEQLMLAESVDRRPDAARGEAERLADAVANTRDYFEAFGAAAAPADAESFAVVLGSVFPEIPAARVREAAQALASGRLHRAE